MLLIQDCHSDSTRSTWSSLRVGLKIMEKDESVCKSQSTVSDAPVIGFCVFTMGIMVLLQAIVHVASQPVCFATMALFKVDLHEGLNIAEKERQCTLSRLLTMPQSLVSELSPSASWYKP